MKSFWENFFNLGTFIICVLLIGVGERYMAHQADVSIAELKSKTAIKCECKCVSTPKAEIDLKK